MGNSNSNVDTSSIDKINDIDEEQLDLSNIDKLQLKAIKQMSERLEQLEKVKSDKLIYIDYRFRFVVFHYFELITLSHNLNAINFKDKNKNH